MRIKISYSIIALVVIIFTLTLMIFFISKQMTVDNGDITDKNIKKSNENLSTQNSNESEIDDGSFDDFGVVDPQSTNHEIIEETEYYKLVRSNDMVNCYFYNEEHEIVKKEEGLFKLPKLALTEPGVLRFTLQAGTGIGTLWGYYYDTNNGVFSETFQGISDQNNGKVACVGSKKVIVRDIFDSEGYYKEFSAFENTFSISAEPIISAEFSSDGKSISVTYLTGSDYKKVTEIFEI